MKTWWWGTLLAAGLATAACGTSPSPARVPEQPVTTENGAHHRADAHRDRHRAADLRRDHAGPAATKKTPVRKTPTRKPPQFGYQCRDGDETDAETDR